MAQVQTPVSHFAEATPAMEALPSQIDPGKDASEYNVDQQEPGSGFEVLGLMRTTSRTSGNAASSRRKSQIDEHISAIPEQDHDEPNPKRSSMTGLSLRSKIKQKLPSMRPGSGGKEEKGHQKHDSVNPDPDFEVLGLMRSNTRTSQDDAPVENKPALERHISSIPQDDAQEEEERPKSSYGLTPKLIRHISSIPSHDYDSEEEDVEEEPKTPTRVEKHDSGTTGSDFEVHGLMRITSNESGKEKAQSPLKKPGLERHISRIPQHDDDSDDDSMLKSTKLARTISSIPGHDYDSEGESPLTK